MIAAPTVQAGLRGGFIAVVVTWQSPRHDRGQTCTHTDHQVCAGTAGVLFAVERLRYAQPGFWLAKVAGREPLRHGRLLND